MVLYIDCLMLIMAETSTWGDFACEPVAKKNRHIELSRALRYIDRLAFDFDSLYAGIK